MASEKCCQLNNTLLFWGVEISWFKFTQVDGEKEGILNIDHEFPKRGEQRWEQGLEHWILKTWLHQTELNSLCIALFFQSTKRISLKQKIKIKKEGKKAKKRLQADPKSLSFYQFSILRKAIKTFLSRKEGTRFSVWFKSWFSPAKELPS